MARKPKNAFESAVKVTACLTRTDCEWDSWMKELFVDSDGDLSAKASCGDEVFVCKLAEIPELIVFLKGVHDASKKV